MTVLELIEKLSALHPQAVVLVFDSEDLCDSFVTDVVKASEKGAVRILLDGD